MSRPLIIGVDFDGTIVEHKYPAIGLPNPGAITAMKFAQQELGARLILWTMRSGRELDEAVAYCKGRGVEFWGVNQNPQQHEWTQSPKAFCHLYIDDLTFGVPLRRAIQVDKPMVDWDPVMKYFMALKNA